MIDPISDFDWATLYSRYDKRCPPQFDTWAESIAVCFSRPLSDRSLYYALIRHFAEEFRSESGISIETYEAMLYWKLYFNGSYVKRMCGELIRNKTRRELTAVQLKILSKEFPKNIPHKASSAISLQRKLAKQELWGTISDSALAVRSTLLHFLYPGSVPIFDTQVLAAVGIFTPKANEDARVLSEYVPFALSLAEKHRHKLIGFQNETAVRLVDMALWVVRGGCN